MSRTIVNRLGVRPRPALLALGERLRKPLVVASGTRRAQWSTVRVEYEVVQ